MSAFAVLERGEMKWRWIALAAFVTSSAVAQVESANLWNAGIGGYATYRVPGIVTTKRGVLLAYCGARKDLSKGDWSATDILLRRSIDGGKTWEPSRKIAGDGIDLTDNVVAIPERTSGAVVFLYQKNYARVFSVETLDDGRTFSAEKEITPIFDAFKKDFEWNVVAPGTGHGIQMKNGRMIASIWLANGAPKPDGTRAHAPSAMGTIYSDDHGRIWHRGDVIARDSPEIENPNETVATQGPDGKVMVNIRSGGPRHLRAISVSDDGATGWSTPRFDHYLFDPICDAGILTVAATAKHPAAIYFVNPDSRDLPKNDKLRFRQDLTLKMSTDNGKTWAHQRVLDAGVSAYSDLTALRDNLFVIYESGSLNGTEAKPDHLTVARVPIEWVNEGEAPQPWNKP
jgi:sialidase-1